MISIDEASVDSMAPNADAIKNGRGLVLKCKFLKLHKSEDDTLLFGECSGSGSKPYSCSSDFANPSSPTHRCSCPSRQFPCKHCLGLMYAFVQGKKFTVAEVPITFTERVIGDSKMSGNIVQEALLKVTVWGLRNRWGKLRGLVGRA